MGPCVCRRDGSFKHRCCSAKWAFLLITSSSWRSISSWPQQHRLKQRHIKPIAAINTPINISEYATSVQSLSSVPEMMSSNPCLHTLTKSMIKAITKNNKTPNVFLSIQAASVGIEWDRNHGNNSVNWTELNWTELTEQNWTFDTWISVHRNGQKKKSKILMLQHIA